VPVSYSPPPLLTAGDVLTLDELRHLRRTSSLRGAWLVLHAWGAIAAAMAFYAWWPTPLVLLPAVVVIGSRQLGLAVLMHEGGHWLLFPRSTVNTGVARWLCAFPIWIDLGRYRRQHHLHHRYTQQPDDPDLEAAGSYPMSRRALVGAALHDLCGWTFITGVLSWPGWREPRMLWTRLRGPLASNAVMLGALCVIGRGELYLLLWLLPLATWYQLVTRLRSMAEHAVVRDDIDPLRNTRTTAAGPLARALLAPYWVNYHLEHHLLIFVPCWKLPQAHALLLAKGYGPRMEMASSYGAVLSRATGSEARAPI
jgi:fatty acid desaturase